MGPWARHPLAARDGERLLFKPTPTPARANSSTPLGSDPEYLSRTDETSVSGRAYMNKDIENIGQPTIETREADSPKSLIGCAKERSTSSGLGYPRNSSGMMPSSPFGKIGK